jgi:hypothetical protein
MKPPSGEHHRASIDGASNRVALVALLRKLGQLRASA